MAPDLAAARVSNPADAMNPTASDDAHRRDGEQRWDAWLIERNRRGARIALWLTVTIYPLFGVLDWLVAPERSLVLLLVARALVTAWSLAFFAVLQTRVFNRHFRTLTAAHAIVLALGIAVMVPIMGGFTTPYYAGLNLTMLGLGLLFVWPLWLSCVTNALIVAFYVIPNGIDAPLAQWAAGIPNLFFVLSTATVVTAAQAHMYTAQREQVANQHLLERTKANLETAHEQLKQLDHFKSKFFANITHELKTPLAMILSPLELMVQGDLGPVTESQKATLQTMERNGVKLLKLINDLLDLSKLEESRLRLNIAEHDLVAYVRSLVGQVQSLALRKNVDMVFEAGVDACAVWCDIERIERVLVNLLSNATKFTPQHGHVWVRVIDRGDRVRIEVKDDGPGFPPEKAERVFERFYQVDMSDSRKHGGTGIGLALARELVSLHGGSIWATAEVGKGACFTLELVKDREHFRPEVLAIRPASGGIAALTAPLETEVLGGAVQVGGSGEFRLLDIAEATERRVVERDRDENERAWTVLVVEDTPDVIRVIHLALRRHFKVMAAPDGLKGFEMAVREQPNLIITDLMMPGIDGLELTRRLRDDPRTRHTPIIMLTARGDLDDRVAGLETGVNAYLAKPFSARELISTARALLNIQETQADLLLTSRLDSLETIAGGLAHEINNPLNYIKNSLKRVQMDVDETMGILRTSQGRELTAAEAQKLAKIVERTQRMFETAESGVRRIAGTVELMGRYSREGYSRVPRPHDVFGAVRDVVGLVLPATGRRVVVSTSFEGDGWLDCIPEEFNQIITNLVQNAIEAVPEETGQVDVTGRDAEGTLTLSVKDNGPGIAEEVRAKIFAPFFTTKGPGRGMGMGLTITRRVVLSLGGTIQCRSQVGAGTEFVLQLPKTAPSRAPQLPLPADG